MKKLEEKINIISEEIKKVEDFVNARIEEQLPLIERRSIPIQQALDDEMSLLKNIY